MSHKLVEKYSQDAGSVAASIKGLTAADFTAVPVPGTWTIGQIVLHLMDSDMIASDRMKRVIAEENPAIVGYNETAFSQRLFYEKQDPFAAAELFRRNREMTAVVLRNLLDSAFSRAGTHSERGRVTLTDLLETYTEHVDHHLKFLRHKRQLLGKPL